MSTTSTSYYLFKYLLFFFFLAYVAIRLSIDITYDEHLTLNTFVDNSFKDLVLCKPCKANNHILNSVLTKCFTSIFSVKLWIARLPNFLFSIVYAFAVFKISNRFGNSILSLLVIVGLLFNPFLIEFFSLSRGYGISYSLMLFGYYYLLRYWKTYETKHLLLSLLGAGFAAYANFSTIHFTASLYFLVLIKWFVDEQPKKKQHIKLFIAISIFFILLFFAPVYRLVKQHQLYYGGNKGFIDDTLWSLTAYSSGYAFDRAKAWPILIVSAVLYGLVCILSLLKGKKHTYDAWLKKLPHLVFIICILSIFSQHYLMGTPWLIDRTALFLYPLFILSFATALNTLTSWEPKVFQFLTLVLVLALSANFLIEANFYKTTEWRHDSRSAEVLNYLNTLAKEKGETYRLDASWPVQRSMEYYASKTAKAKVLAVNVDQNLDSIDERATHYLFYNTDLISVGYARSAQFVETRIVDTLLFYPEEQLYLFSLK
jgi:hypothetical protein